MQPSSLIANLYIERVFPRPLRCKRINNERIAWSYQHRFLTCFLYVIRQLSLNSIVNGYVLGLSKIEPRQILHIHLSACTRCAKRCTRCEVPSLVGINFSVLLYEVLCVLIFLLLHIGGRVEICLMRARCDQQ